MGGDASSASNLLYSPGDDFVFLNAFVAADDCWDDSGAQISCPGDWAYPKFDVVSEHSAVVKWQFDF